MSTYEEFMVVLTVALLIVAILNLKNKKSSPGGDDSENATHSPSMVYTAAISYYIRNSRPALWNERTTIS